MATELDKLVIKIEADLSELKKGLKDSADLAASSSSKISSAFDAIRPSLLAVGTAAVAAGAAFVALTKHTFDAADELNGLSQRTGLSTKFLQEMGYAASQLNVDSETLNSSLGVFARTLGAAAAGNDEAEKAFKRLGVSVRDSNGHARDSETVFNEVAKAMDHVKEGADRATVAQSLFGRGGLAMVNIFSEGAAGLDAFRDKANALGLVISDKLIKGADETNDKLATLSMVLKAQVSQALLELAPFIQRVTDGLIGMTSWTAKVAEGWGHLFSMMGGGASTADEKMVRLTGRINELQDSLKAREHQFSLTPATEDDIKVTAKMKAEVAALKDQIVGLGAAEADRDKARGKPKQSEPAGGFLDIGGEDRQKALDEANQKEIEGHFNKIEAMRALDTEKYNSDIALEESRLNFYLAHMDQHSTAYLQNAAKLKQIDQKAAEDKKKLDQQKVQDQQASLNWISSLQYSKSKEMAAIGKAAAIASTTISTYEAAQKAFSSFAGIPLIGPALGAAAAAAAVAAGLSRVASIAGTDIGFNSGVDRVPGVGAGDTVSARLTPGERVVPKDTNAMLEEWLLGMKNMGGGSGKVSIELSLKDDLGRLIEAKLNEREALNISTRAA